MVNNIEEQLELTYTGVLIHNQNHVIVPTIVDEFADDNRDHALVYHWMDSEWVQHLIENSICGVCAINEPTTKVLNVGVDGEVAVAAIPGGESFEQVDPSDLGPNYSETLRCVKSVNNTVYVAGMARQVYKRSHPQRWVRWDSGVYIPRGQRNQSLGILDIDGFENGLLYTAGYKGEIWYFNGNSWIQEESPTNVALTCLICVDTEEVYIGGMSGTLIQGYHDNWRLIDQDATSQDFWGIAHFLGNTYLSNYEGVFLLETDNLSLIDFGLERSITTAYLHAADGVMWSVGQKDLAYTDDGVSWYEVEKP